MNFIALVVFLIAVLLGLTLIYLAIYWVILNVLFALVLAGITVFLYLVFKKRRALILLSRDSLVFIGGIILVVSILTLIFEIVQPESKSGCFIMGNDRCSE